MGRRNPTSGGGAPPHTGAFRHATLKCSQHGPQAPSGGLSHPPLKVTLSGVSTGSAGLYVTLVHTPAPGGLPQICSCAGQLLVPIWAYCPFTMHWASIWR